LKRAAGSLVLIHNADTDGHLSEQAYDRPEIIIGEVDPAWGGLGSAEQTGKHRISVVRDRAIEVDGVILELESGAARAFTALLDRRGKTVTRRELDELIPKPSDPLLSIAILMRRINEVAKGSITYARQRRRINAEDDAWTLDPSRVEVVDRREDIIDEHTLMLVGPWLGGVWRARRDNPHLNRRQLAEICQLALPTYDDHVAALRLRFDETRQAVAAGTFDYASWAEQIDLSSRWQSPLLYLTKMGRVPSPDTTVTEMRNAAIAHLSDVVFLDDIDKMLVARQYGLEGDQLDGPAKIELAIELKVNVRQRLFVSNRLLVGDSARRDSAPSLPDLSLLSPRQAVDHLRKMSKNDEIDIDGTSAKGLEAYCQQVCQRLAEDGSTHQIWGSLPDGVGESSVMAIVKTICKYSMANGYKLADNTERDIAIAEAYLKDVGRLIELGCRQSNVHHVARILSPRMLLSLYRRYEKMVPRQHIASAISKNLTGYHADLEQMYVRAVDDEWGSIQALLVGEGYGEVDKGWQREAACRDVDPRTFDTDNSVARYLCGSCVVSKACLESELHLPLPPGAISGYRAGKTAEERRSLLLRKVGELVNTRA
jgi:hypothetical protein